MNKLLLIGIAAGAMLGFATAASADATGVVNITGTVPAQCGVVTGGPVGGSTFGSTVSLNVGGTIADANGHLLPALNTSTTNAASVTQSFQVNCTGAGNHVTLAATPLAIASPPTAQTGYVSTVSYTAEADFAVTSGAPNPVKLTQASGGSTSGDFASGVRLANAANNITIKAFTFNTAGGFANDILDAGAYAGAITVTVGPGV
ncbi:MAG: hypothetical protein ACHP7N_02415 [Caulobacterales bacterium]